MSGVRVEIDVEDEEVTRVFERLLGALDDPGPALAQIGEYGVQSTRERIEGQNFEDPLWPWELLTPAYLVSKRKREHHPDSILILYGELVSTLAYQAQAAEVGWGSGRAYAAAQQFGREEINLPARPFLGLTERDTTEVLAIMQRFLAAAATP